MSQKQGVIGFIITEREPCGERESHQGANGDEYGERFESGVHACAFLFGINHCRDQTLQLELFQNFSGFWILEEVNVS